MLSSFLKIAVRNLLTRKGFALLNILGLVIGMTSCLLVFQYVSYERSYDRFEPASSSIYRLRLDQYEQGQLQWKSATVVPAIGPTLKKDYPEVEKTCRLYNWPMVMDNPKTNVQFSETKGYCVDPAALQMLGVELIEGDPATALSQPYQLVLSQSMARKYFGSADAVGKQLEIRTGNAAGNRPYIVSGIYKDYPANAHLVLQYLTPYSTLESYYRYVGDTTDAVNTSFFWYDYYVYVQFKPGTDAGRFESKLPAFCDRYINNIPKNKGNQVRDELHLVPLHDIHLYSNSNEEAETNGNGQAVAFLFMIGIFILGIAWINYINLATARSVERAREVGIRKVMGAVRTDLIRQFMLESVLLNMVALVMAVGAAYALAPVFNGLMGNDTLNRFGMTGSYWLIFVGLLAGGVLLSGLYPAFVLSGYEPIKVLKGAFKNTSGGLMLRKSLIVFQFAISVILIAGTMIVYQQVRYMRHQRLGADIDQTVVLTGPQVVQESAYKGIYQSFKNDLRAVPGIRGVSASSNVMGQEITWTRGLRAMQKSAEVTMYVLDVDYDFIPQYGIRLLAGRNYSAAFPGDANHKSIMLNAQGAMTLGFASPEAAIGQKILGLGDDTLTVIGVAENVHFLGLQRPIDPQAILYNPMIRETYSIKLSGHDMHDRLTAIEKVWSRYFPEQPFSYFFLDDYYSRQYRADEQFGKTFTLFAVIAIFIACCGLMGLSAYNILQRTKEIGIRKVLGASTQHVVYILSADFLRLVGLAFLLAIPVAWWVMHAWLQEYAYRISIRPGVFVIAGAVAMAIALVTISVQAVRAAVAKPVESLRADN
jgi:putative ABC transport system permease protein